MSGQHRSVADLLASGGSKPQTIEQRIERRLQILREWLREGVPAGKAIPKNLKAARIWEDAELGIFPIGSPNEFTTTHDLFGRQVRDIAELLTSLHKRFGKPVGPSAPGPVAPVSKFDRRASERQLQAAVSQWQAERDQRLQEKKRADTAEARSVLLLEENKQKDQLIADLRRQLAAHGGLRVVE